MEKIYELLRNWIREAEQPKPEIAPKNAKDKEAIQHASIRRPHS